MMKMELEILRQRILSGVNAGYLEKEYFYKCISDFELKHALDFRCNKNIINGQNCFNCAYNMHPNRIIGTTCGILNYVFADHADGCLFINHPQKSVCAFCKTR